MLKLKRTTGTGYTLVEIVVVVIIAAVISGLALPRYFTTIEKMRAKEGEQILISLYGSQKRFSIDNGGSYADDLSELDIDPQPSAHFTNIDDSDIDSGNPIARIRRTGSYTLSIDDVGSVTCAGGPANLCSQMGY